MREEEAFSVTALPSLPVCPGGATSREASVAVAADICCLYATALIELPAANNARSLPVQLQQVLSSSQASSWLCRSLPHPHIRCDCNLCSSAAPQRFVNTGLKVRAFFIALTP